MVHSSRKIFKVGIQLKIIGGGRYFLPLPPYGKKIALDYIEFSIGCFDAVLPRRDRYGRRILIGRPGNWDVDKFSFHALFNVSWMTLEMVANEEVYYYHQRYHIAISLI